MQQRNDPYSTAPQDAHERERLANVHPAGWRNPQPADRYSLVVIGAGTAGLVAEHAAAALGAKVALIERNLLGGDCLNVGCVPSKAIIRTSRLYAEMRNAEQYGVRTPADIRVEFAAVMQRMRGIRTRISRADSVCRLISAGVDVFFGQACFTGTDALTVDGLRLRFKKALIATGAQPSRRASTEGTQHEMKFPIRLSVSQPAQREAAYLPLPLKNKYLISAPTASTRKTRPRSPKSPMPHIIPPPIDPSIMPCIVRSCGWFLGFSRRII